MFKKQIKKQIKKTGTYKVIEIENKSLKNQLETLHDHFNRVKNENLDFKRLVTNLKVENRSLKEIYLEDNISFPQDYNKLTVIVPYRKTNEIEREKNLDITLTYLSKIGIKNLIISEHADVTSRNSLENTYKNSFASLKFIFANANGNSFNKAHAINQGVIASETPYFVIVDVDCLTKKKNIDMAIYLLEKGFDVVHSFNRVVKDIMDKERFRKEYDFEGVNSPAQYREWADGGIVFWNKQAFIDIGMKNEYFSGWGGEDNEILIRANLCELKQIRIDDTLYHLYHDRPQIRTKNNVEQMEKILKIESKDELLTEINKWPWIEKIKK